MSRFDMFLKKILLPKQNEKDGKTVKEQVMMSQGNQHYLSIKASNEPKATFHGKLLDSRVSIDLPLRTSPDMARFTLPGILLFSCERLFTVHLWIRNKIRIIIAHLLFCQT